MGKDLKGKELGKGISQRKDGYYLGRFVSRSGKRRQKPFRKLQECRQWLADARFRDEHSDLNLPDQLTVDAWFQKWASIKEKTVRKGSVECYRKRYNMNIKPVIGDLMIQEVKPIQCQMIFNEMADSGYCSSTMSDTREVLHGIFDYALQNDIIGKNPCNKTVKCDIGGASKQREPLTLAEQRKFLQGIAGTRYELQYRFQLQTGLRAGEMIGLKWSDVDFDNGAVKISRSAEYKYSEKRWVLGEPKSKAGYRTIPLTPEALKILGEQKQKDRQIKIIPMEWSDCIFLNAKGFPVKNSTYDGNLYLLCSKLGLRSFSMHTLRHTFATRCIEGGMKPKTLQTLMGHSNIGITMNLYVHTTEDEKQNEVQKIADFLMAI